MLNRCQLRLHDWDGCVCRICSKQRDEGHRWKGCRCNSCGKIRNEGHDFLNVQLTCPQCKTAWDMTMKEAYSETLAQVMPLLLKELKFPLGNNHKALESLERIGWQPQSIEERVCVYLLRGNKQALVTLGSAAVPWLIKEIPWNTKFVVVVLGEIYASMMTSPEDIKCRESIVSALAQRLDELNHLHSYDPERSSALIKALGKIGNARALPQLIAAMRNEYMQDSAGTIVDIISNLGAGAVPSMVKELHNPLAHVPGLAAKALVKIGQPAVPTLVDELKTKLSSSVRAIVIQTLEELGWQPQTMDEKIPVWLDRRNLDELIKLGQRGSAALLEELRATGYSDESLRVGLVDALGLIGDRTAVPALLQIIMERDAGWSYSGMAAASALGKMGDKSAVPVLTKVIKSGDAMEVHFDTLAKLSEGKASPELLNMLKVGQHWQRKAAAFALEKISDPAVVPDLVIALVRAEKEENIAYDEYNAISNALFKFGHPDGNYLYIITSSSPIIDGMQSRTWTKLSREELKARKEKNLLEYY